MTAYELEVAAYAAAHRIYNGLPEPDRPCPGGYRSRFIDVIADTIKQALSVHMEGATYTLKRQVNGGKRGVDVKQPEMVPDEMLRFTLVMTGKEWLALRAALDDTLLAIELREVLDEPEVVVRRHPHDPIGGAYIAVVQA